MADASDIERSALIEFRELLKKDQKFGSLNLSDNFLLEFLRCKSNNPNKAYERMCTFSRKLYQYPELFDWNADLANGYNSNVLVPTTGTSNDGSCLLIYQPGQWIISQATPLEGMRALTLFYACYQDPSKHCVHVVCDSRNLTMSHLIAFGIRTARLQMELMTKVMPTRIIKIHLVHANRLIKIGLGLYWPFMPKKLRERIIIHGDDMDELYQCCPASSLPSFLGGTHEQISLDEFLATIKKNKESVINDWKQLIAAESKILTENNN